MQTARRSEQADYRGDGYRAGRVFGIVLLAAVLFGVVGVGAFAQKSQPAPAVEEPENGIVRGTVVAVEADRLKVRDNAGVVREMEVNGTTLVITDDEDFSIANMAEIQLEVGDLSAGDAVEVVLEPNPDHLRAGIVTRMSAIAATATATSSPR